MNKDELLKLKRYESDLTSNSLQIELCDKNNTKISNFNINNIIDEN